MKITVILIVLLTAGSVIAVQAQNTPAASPWKTYTVKGERFSVALPALPAMHRQQKYFEGIDDARRELLLGAYANGVVYTVYVLENTKPKMSLSDFVAEQAGRGSTWNLKKEIKVTRDGLSGKAYNSVNPEDGMIQFFVAEGRLYEFIAFGAPAEDERVTQFFSSVSFANSQAAVEVKDGPGLPFEHARPPGENEKHYVGKEVTRKVRLAMKPEPQYTEAARQNGIAGTVVLKCTFNSDGLVRNIRLVSGLPFGLSEKAIDAASKIRFIPAIKDGKFVSMWIQLEYNFNLF